MTSNKHQWREINRYSALICYLYLFKSTFIYTRGIIEGETFIYSESNETKTRKNNNKEKYWQRKNSFATSQWKKAKAMKKKHWNIELCES